MTVRRAIIFGGSGFIGSHLTSELIDLGFEVHVADLAVPRIENVKFHFCDVREPIEISENFDVAFNLAAIHRTPGHDPNEYFETNVSGALNITNWCSLNKIHKLVFTSTIAVYGDLGQIATEDSSLHPLSNYGRSKKIAEQIHLNWYSHRPNENSLMIVRPAAIFGFGEGGNFTRMARFMRFGIFFVPTNSANLKECGYVKDLTRLLVSFVNNKSNKVLLNFTFQETYSIREICDTFSKVFQYPTVRTLRVNFLFKCLSIAPGRLGQIGLRAQKLNTHNLISKNELISYGFEWKYSLESAVRDWSTSNHGNKSIQ